MAYGDVVSLKHTIEHLQGSPHISLIPPSPEITELAYREVESLELALQSFDRSGRRKKVNVLDEQIRETVCEFQDLIESHVSNQILSQSEESINGDHDTLFSINLLDVNQDVQSFIETVKEMKVEYVKEVNNPFPEEEEEDDDDGVVSSRMDSDEKQSEMVGLVEQWKEVKTLVINHVVHRLSAVTLVGMAGIGKTTLAKKIYKDVNTAMYFHYRVWVVVGRTYRFEETLRQILNQVNDHDTAKGDEELSILAQCLKESLRRQRYLIVLDDVWDLKVWQDMSSVLPKERNGSVVLLTTRRKEVAREIDYGLMTLHLRLLNKQESWDLLRQKVFADQESCTYQLEMVGRKIAEKCEGLPLLIVEMAALLSGAEKTPEYWNEVVERRNSIFDDAYEGISKVLSPSYEHLSQYLKPCFLYMGVFPQSYKIPHSRLINMWISERLLEPNKHTTLEHLAAICLKQLFSNNVAVVYEESTRSWRVDKGRAKTCGLHSSFSYFCNKVARKNKIYRILHHLNNALDESIVKQRRLCFHNNMLFAIKDVYDSLESNCAITARSVLFLGPYHQYQVPICFGLRLLRVLDALGVRFYVLPLEVLKLVQLTFLALTYNGELPSSISKLRNLQFLIVCPHQRIIKSSLTPFFLPMEIWDMKELKHLRIMGGDLPTPSLGTSLPNLLSLLDVSTHSCTKNVLEGLTNLKKLGIRIEWMPEAEPGLESWSCFEHVICLRKLESLKCVVVNPQHRSKVVASRNPPIRCLSSFPNSLEKLTLSGLGYPWEEMSSIASLPNLKILKLQCYAFRGPKWEIQENGFLKLSYLLIEDTDLMEWKAGDGCFPVLICVRMKDCYKLNEISFKYYSKNLRRIEVIDCSPLTLISIKKLMKDSRKETREFHPRVDVQSSWDDVAVQDDDSNVMQSSTKDKLDHTDPLYKLYSTYSFITNNDFLFL